MSKLKEVCAYVRVSTDKQEELSPDSQIRLIKEYAQQHDMLLTHIYMEEHGISGKRAEKRPAFQEMIAACKDKSHPFDAILLWKFSRFARNIDESTYYKSVLRKKCGVDVISISEPITEGMYGRLIEMVIEWSDEFYLHNLSGEVMRGMTQKALKGGYNANAPIGYVKEKGNDKIPVVDEDSSLIVKKIFDMYVNQNRALSDIASILNQSGYRTKRGGRFETRTVSYILENPFYIGKIRWNYFDRQKNSRKNTADVIITDGKHTPIISEELFAAAGKRLAMERQRTNYGKKRPVAASKHWMSGMIKCYKCGASLGYNAGNPKKKTPAYFQCWKHGKGLCDCFKNNRINAKKAENEILRILQAYADSNINFAYNSFDKIDENTEYHLLEKELNSLKAKSQRIKEAYINGIDSIDEYRENKKMIEERREFLKEKLTSASAPAEPQSTNRSIDFQNLIDLISDDTADYISKGNAIRQVFDHFEYNREKDEMSAVLDSCIDIIPN